MDLNTTYLGVKLRTPLVPSASPLSENLDNIKRIEEAGAAAIVLQVRSAQTGDPGDTTHTSSVLYLNVGTVTRRELRERAVELAVTDGRSAQDASNADWEQAKREVLGAPDMAPRTQQPKA